MSLVMVKFHVGIMITYIVFILSIVFVMSFVGFATKPSPIYGGLVLIISGGIGCAIVLNFGGSFLVTAPLFFGETEGLIWHSPLFL